MHTDGRRTLDPAGTEPLPVLDDGGKIPADAVRAVMRRTLPVRATWFDAEGQGACDPPESWAEHPMLGDLRVLYQPVQDGTVHAVTVGGKALRLDEDLGLERQ
ncbi:hypothetical protein [Streptomyces minutiscleroticus]|uniref:hypothetical protein n=1 Tax=Streptomyces minutiscleroticus TaxID=68238 RepID=UPI0033242101